MRKLFRTLVARVGWAERSDAQHSDELQVSKNARTLSQSEKPMKYIRAWHPGGTYFFTVNLVERSRTLLVDHVNHLRETVRKVKLMHPFDIVAWVVLPDHLHAVWTLPEGDADCSMRWSLIKAGFSRGIAQSECISPRRLG